jgi:hypothetical protein
VCPDLPIKAPVDNECFLDSKFQKHSLSTGASREALVDNESQ